MGKGVRASRGVSLLETLVCLAIISIPVAVVIPVVRYTRHYAKLSACLDNAGRTGRAMMLYVDAHDGYLPQGSRYPIDLMLEGFAKAGTTGCPDLGGFKLNADGTIPIYSTNNSMDAGLTRAEREQLYGKIPSHMTQYPSHGYYLLTLGQAWHSFAYNYRGNRPQSGGAFTTPLRLMDYPTSRIYAAECNALWPKNLYTYAMMDVMMTPNLNQYTFCDLRHKGRGTVISVTGNAAQYNFLQTTKQMWVFPNLYTASSLAPLPQD